MKPIKVVLLIFIVVAFALAYYFFSFLLRHVLGEKIFVSYPISVTIIKDNQKIRSSLRDQPFVTAPTWDMFWKKITGKSASYSMIVDVKTNDGEKGRVYIAYQSPLNEPRIPYTLQWAKDGKSYDIFGTYPAQTKTGDKKIRDILKNYQTQEKTLQP